MPYNGALNLVSPAANRVYQREVRYGNPEGPWIDSYGKGWANISLNVSPTVAPRVVEYRVRDAASPAAAPLLDWTVTPSVVGPGPGAVAVLMPARRGWSLIDIRADGDNAGIVSTSAIGVGEVIAASGQSLATDFWSTVASGDPATLASCGVQPSAYGACLASWDGAAPPSPTTGWGTPDDLSPYRSSFCAEFLRLAVQGTGVNCGLVGYAWSGEPIASWRSDGLGPKDVWTPLITTFDNAVGQGGKFGTFLWMHGHNDARLPLAGIDGDELETNEYLSALGRFFAALSARYNGMQFSRILSSIPAIGSKWITVVPKFDPLFINKVRAAHLNYAQIDPLVAGHVDGLDVPLWIDQTHPSQAGNVTLGRHFYRAFMATLGGGTYSMGDAGPKFDGIASRPPGTNRIYLRLSPFVGRSLDCVGGASGAVSQFRVFKSGSVSPTDQFSLQSADLSQEGFVVLTLAFAPDDGQSLDVWYRLPPDSDTALLPGNQIYDSNSGEMAVDGLTMGRQLAMRATPIMVPAPSWHGPILIGPGTPMFSGSASAAFVL